MTTKLDLAQRPALGPGLFDLHRDYDPLRHVVLRSFHYQPILSAGYWHYIRLYISERRCAWPY